MSVIVAIKQNGVVYMGADTQTTTSKTRMTGLNETAFKITKLENGMLIGFCGLVAAKQEILSIKNLFILNERGEIDKKHIVNNIVPKLADKLDAIGDEESGALDVSILIAHKNKLYKITSKLDVISLNNVGASGAGLGFSFYYLYAKTNLPIKQRILKSLAESAKRTESVGGPYVLIDTKNLQYEIIDLGDENH